MTTQQVATYKGRKYRLMWAGETKYGRRAKLAFFDGSKEFWVDESKVNVSAGANGHRHSSHCCKGCGGPIVDASHHRAMEGYCGTCAFDEFDC